MNTTTSFFVELRRESGLRQTVRRLGGRLADRWRAALQMTAQERADTYVARTPIAVLAD